METALAEKNSIRFKGHESFIIREGWINKGLFAVKTDNSVFSKNYGADALGVGPNMAKAIRYWLRVLGLIEESPKTGSKLSALGEIIYDNDPYIEDSFTLWLMHCQIAMNEKQATAWSIFYNKFSFEEFKREQLIQEMRESADKMVVEYDLKKKVADRSIVDDCDAILHMYTIKNQKEGTPEDKNTSPFSKLRLLEKDQDVFCRKQPDLGEMPEDIILYLMGKNGITSKSLEDLLAMDNGPGKLLQLKRNGLMELMDRLEARNAVSINRTAGLYMIYLEEEKSGEEIVLDYYRR